MNCDPIARLYRWLEYAAFGRALERRRAAFLGEVSGARRVLALGDGDGRALAALVASAPGARIDYVDSSAKMLALARARAGTDRVRYRQADARDIDFAEFGECGGRRNPAAGDSGYDLIVTHFFLDCFEEADLRAVVQKTARAAAPSARWIVSEFRPATVYARLAIAVMYAFFRRATELKARRLADHHPHFLRQGFRLERVEGRWAGMLASELWVR